MPDIVLTRTGLRPLAFTGDHLAGDDGKNDGGPASTRWWEIDVYQTAAGQIVAHLQWVTNWQGEQNHSEAHVSDTLEQMMDLLEEVNPLEYVRGYPDDAKYRARQAALEAAIAGGFAAAVSRIAARLNVVEQL